MLRSIMLNGSALCSMGMFDDGPFKGWMAPKGGGSKTDTKPQGQPAQTGGTDGGSGDEPSVRKTNAQTQNDDTDDADELDSIWADEVDDGNPPANDKTKQQQRTQDDQQRGGGNEPDPQAQLQSYFKKIGLDPVVLSDAEKEALKTGEGFEAVLARINDKVQTAHLKAITGIQELFNKRLPQIVEEAVTKARGERESGQYKDLLQKDPQLPMASDPKYAVLVEGVFKRFIDKGLSVQRAQKLTRAYFKDMYDQYDPNAQVDNTTGGNFRRERRTPQKPGKTDFIAMLRGESDQ